PPPPPRPPGGRRRRRPPQDIDFGRYERRYIALELAYCGSAYGGFARQENGSETIESRLFAALESARLTRPGAPWAEELCYSRGGRTDRGVSALRQVVALWVRSGARRGQGLPAPDAEIDYPRALNRVLPKDIRVTGWADVDEAFSARFSASYREYRYIFLTEEDGEEGMRMEVECAMPSKAENASVDGFPVAVPRDLAPPSALQTPARHSDASLSLGAMRAAASHFVGTHDFRNFCKVDVSAARHFQRTVLSCSVRPLPALTWGCARALELRVVGTAFLWHQIRCMAAVLRSVGQGREDPGVVARLLDVEAEPRKPLYAPDDDRPLLLLQCAYEGGRLMGNEGQVDAGTEKEAERSIEAPASTPALPAAYPPASRMVPVWRRSQDVLDEAVHSFAARRDECLLEAAVAQRMLATLNDRETTPRLPSAGGCKRKARGSYVALLQRPREPALEDRRGWVGARVKEDVEEET
ncbi:hypothetical protein H632_c2465p1, partial [Helicosporidium sp. ATCC 50920]